MDSSPTFPSNHVSSILNSQSFASNLKEVGFALIDGILGKEWKEGLRKEIQMLFEKGLLYPNATYYEGKKDSQGKFVYGYSVSKPNVFELDLFSINPQERIKMDIPYLNALYQDRTILNEINRAIPELSLDSLDVKIQYNSGSGGCFPMHFDTTTTVSNRRITGTLYLNPNWEEKDGGQLRIYPFPFQKLDVDPVDDRLVLFSSHQTLHRVLPSHASSRYCITLWFSSTAESSKTVQLPSFSWLRGVEGIGFLLNQNTRKSLAKVVFDKDWAESIQQSFGGQEDQIQKILATHKKETELIKSQVGPDIVSFMEECLPLVHGDEFITFSSPVNGTIKAKP